MQILELLAPAKNLECGIAAVDHGADAVYIGANRFGARAAAGNSVEDILALCQYAHRWGVKVFVTVNTILYDHELEETQALLHTLAEGGVDAIIVQDMGLLKMNLPKICLHASTQTDNRTVEKVDWLYRQGFDRVVLARELSCEEIAKIHQALPTVELEAFVHGALCVSYSGVCYASQHLFDRSANRGACAQFCRMKFDLVDADGKEILHQRHLLSLKDLCLIHRIEDMAAAGVTSFKIEGRLKDIDYVKNVVAAYSQKLNQLVQKYPDRYQRASLGKVDYTFQPNLQKTFHRDYTTYFSEGRKQGIASFDTPKSKGAYVGKVKSVERNFLTVASQETFSNGDGLCFINEEGVLEGFRVNRVEGKTLFPHQRINNLKPGTALYRNYDEAFTKQLARNTAVRKIAVDMKYRCVSDGFALDLSLTVHSNKRLCVTATLPCRADRAQKTQTDNIIRQLTKLGNTAFVCQDIQVDPQAANYFVPSGQLNDLRRQTVEMMEQALDDYWSGLRNVTTQRPIDQQPRFTLLQGYDKHPFLYNISNKLATQYYREQGLEQIQPAFEIQTPAAKRPLLMQCRHCLRFELGHCVVHGGKKPTWKEPLSLRLADGRHFPLTFDCKACQMNVYAE